MNYVLIPLNQGLFLNTSQLTVSAISMSLNPFESGSVFKLKLVCNPATSSVS